jgi:ABC-2 type transport system ATP-binding protein
MIHVERLTKYYGDYPAVRDVSFHVPEGMVVGFLGPNGAGKSTTMRILAGYQTATAGHVTINGINVFWRPVEARRHIGYMPESCPLYPEMRVEEYLRFRAGLKGVYGAQRRKRMAFVLERCWLKNVNRQLIGTLSKGYKQRVGLADALIANPKILILDEPTAGLDPTQIRETRNLIRELGRDHTVMLSTHILSEVEMTCDRVIVIHRGTVALEGPLGDLGRHAGEKAVLCITAEGEIDLEPFQKLDYDHEVENTAGGSLTRVRIRTINPDTLAAKISHLAATKGFRLRELRTQKQTLEDVFVRITSNTGS